jgi:hypothetical protein
MGCNDMGGLLSLLVKHLMGVVDAVRVPSVIFTREKANCWERDQGEHTRVNR